MLLTLALCRQLPLKLGATCAAHCMLHAPEPTRPPKTTTADLTSALLGGRIVGLDFLRAVAVMLVLGDHSGAYLLGVDMGLNGGLGVELFFVLSGFLITWMLQHEFQKHQTIDFRAFYWRRLLRLMPIFYVYVILCLLMLALLHRPIPWGAVVSGLTYTTNYYQALHDAPTHFLSHCWSLAVEEQFYFLWPMALWLILKRKLPPARAIVLLIGLIWLHRSVLFLSGWADDAYLYRALDTLADHLLAGCLLAVWLRDVRHQQAMSRITQRAPWLLLLIGSALMLSGHFHGDRGYRYLVAYALEPMLMAALIPMLITFAHARQGPVAALINSRPVVAIGQASYGIYLFHPVLLHPVRHVVERLSNSFTLAMLISVSVLSVLAWLSFRFFETPLRLRFAAIGTRAPSSPLTTAS